MSGTSEENRFSPATRASSPDDIEKQQWQFPEKHYPMEENRRASQGLHTRPGHVVRTPQTLLYHRTPVLRIEQRNWPRNVWWLIHSHIHRQFFKAWLCWDAGDENGKTDIQPLLPSMSYERLQIAILSHGLVPMQDLLLSNLNTTNGYGNKQVPALVKLSASWEERVNWKKKKKSTNEEVRQWQEP